jgi:D-serine deaminase-like pyridoxal phosphate-dependent protein
MNPTFEGIDQPTLLLDEAAARRNIHFMAEKARRLDVHFRPHFKTHQSAVIGEWFRQEGVSQITVSSVEMAEYFADHGWQDICIAFSVNLRQVQRLEALAKRIHLEVLVENSEAIRALERIQAADLDVWLKIDTGAHRTGLDWQQTAGAASLCREVDRVPRLNLRGLLTHAGQTYTAHSNAQVVEWFTESVLRLHHLKDELALLGLEPLEISVGDTPGCTLAENFEDADEIRPGNFVFYDVHQLSLGVCDFRDIAVAVACPVVALHPEREEVVIYGGAVHLSKESVTWQGVETYGLVSLAEGNSWSEPIAGAFVARVSQEHGILHYPGEAMQRHPLQVGELTMVIPAHSCLAVQALGEYRTLAGNQIPAMPHPYRSRAA